MSIYTRANVTANNILSKLGQSVMLTHKTAGSYNPATGTASNSDSQETGTGAVFDYGTKDVDGKLILQGDKQLLLSTQGITAPKVKDTVTIAGLVYSVESVSTLSPAGTVVLYELNIRGQ